MTESDIDELIQKTVRQTLLQIGLDVSTPEAVKDLQKDFAHTRAWRRLFEGASVKAAFLMVGLIITGGFSVLLLGVQSWLHKGD